MNLSEFKSTYEKVPVEEFPHTVPSDVKVSVCVQTYNHGEYIRECLESILSQKTDFNYEILVGEDASSDNTREVCIELAEKFPEKIRLFLHHRENNIFINGNPTGRFNMLYNFSSAQGEYIAFCEGDDYWIDEYKLQRQSDFLDQNPKVSLLGENSKVIDEINGTERIFSKDKEQIQIQIKDLLKGRKFHTASILFRKSYLNLPPNMNQFPIVDTILFISLAKMGEVIYAPH
ncbi:MAG: glycosyltransferase family 2 protein, partial [Weeksellaceae bacterium]